ncbi:unnamed protein product [Chrysoparadoxa australica]
MRAARLEAEMADEEATANNDDFCSVCSEKNEMDLLCCDSCPRSFHLACMGMLKVPAGDWHCEYCLKNRAEENKASQGAVQRYDPASHALVCHTPPQADGSPTVREDPSGSPQDAKGSGSPTQCEVPQEEEEKPAAQEADFEMVLNPGNPGYKSKEEGAEVEVKPGDPDADEKGVEVERKPGDPGWE